MSIDYYIGISLENGLELEVKEKLIAFPRLKKVNKGGLFSSLKGLI